MDRELGETESIDHGSLPVLGWSRWWAAGHRKALEWPDERSLSHLLLQAGARGGTFLSLPGVYLHAARLLTTPRIKCSFEQHRALTQDSFGFSVKSLPAEIIKFRFKVLWAILTGSNLDNMIAKTLTK